MPAARSQPDESDEVLFERWRDGDARAGEALFHRHFLSVERFFINKMPHDVDDLVQETFLACVKGREQVKYGGKFRSYLFAVARNLFGQALRKKYRMPPAVTLDAISLEELAPDAAAQMMHKDEQRLLLEALRTIKIEQQIVLELAYWEDFTTEQLAEVLAIPVGTARGQLQRARRDLERALESLADSLTSAA